MGLTISVTMKKKGDPLSTIVFMALLAAVGEETL